MKIMNEKLVGKEVTCRQLLGGCEKLHPMPDWGKSTDL